MSPRSFGFALPPPPSPPLAFIVEEWLKSRRRRGVSPEYLKTISTCSRRMVRWFPGPLSSLSAPGFMEYLDGLPGKSARTRNNHLGIARQIVRYAQRMGWISREWAELDKLEKEIEPRSDAGIYSPAELRALLRKCPAEIRPLIVLVALCGVRTAEAARLTWANVDLESARVTIAAARAKTRARRLCPVPECAGAWLAKGKDCAQRLSGNGGRIYRGSARQLQDDLREAFRLAGVQMLRNGLRHSFISYRVALTQDAARTALEAGTSEGMVFANYRSMATAEAAREWFAAWPEDVEWRMAA